MDCAKKYFPHSCFYYFLYRKDLPNMAGHKEDNMIEVTEAATQKIAEYFNGKEVSPIRIFLNQGG